MVLLARRSGVLASEHRDDDVPSVCVIRGAVECEATALVVLC